MSRNRTALHAYILCLFLSFPVLALCPVQARAHSPNGVVLQYDSGSRMLNTAISHPVSNPRKHYVKKVTITRNGEPVATHEYTSQPESSSFTYTYRVEAKAGDVLKVTADCNYFGSKTGELTVDK